MKKFRIPEPLTLEVESLSHDGRGIATVDGKTTFISGAIANEKVSCQIIKQHSRYNEAKVLDVLIPAPSRTQPLCNHFGVCGGCSLQHMTTESQVHIKQQTVLDQLKHFGKVTPEIIMEPLTGNPWHYRRKARLGVRYVRNKDRVLVGFREIASNFLTDIHSCPVLHETVGTKIVLLTELIRSLTQFDQIPQIEVAVSDNETALVFRHLTPLPEEDRIKLCAFAKQHGMHFYLQPNSPDKIHKIWPPGSSEKLTYRLPEYQLNMQFYPLDFIQVNSNINLALIGKAIQLLEPKSSETILDLFCGLGNFTLPLARHADRVIGVEGSAEMVQRAKENAEHNLLPHVEFYVANLTEPEISAPWLKMHYDKILLDPPRTGAKEILPVIAKLGAKRICYVSCNPATLARDAGELVYTYGYKLKQVGVVDMFPHTSHIETIALFER